MNIEDSQWFAKKPLQCAKKASASGFEGFQSNKGAAREEENMESSANFLEGG